MSIVVTSDPEFVFLGEHSAIDFANTQVAGRGGLVELLGSWGDVIDWLEESGVLRKNTRAARMVSSPEEAVERVRAFRSTWREEISRLIERGRISESFTRLLNQFLEKDSFHETLRSGEGRSYRMDRSPSSLRGEDLVLAALAREIAHFLAHSNFSYLRKCANSECVLFFYDTTKNHRRQWCSTAVCGNRHKVAAFRERQARKRRTR
ncbi:MAG TPA: CGNR zinc finger domain-containing protein [Terrimicrobiaceae bacterium]|nr:CGNR zinc finger domain-containing protein [Terrimicrobiaceae bacterium]